MKMEAGQYYGKLADAEVIKFGANETECVQFDLDVEMVWANGAWAPLDDAPLRKHLRLFTTPKAWPYTEEKLQALSFEGDFRNMRFRADFYEGLALKLTFETNGGKQYERWDFEGLGGAAVAPAPTSLLDELNAKWKQGNPAAPAHGSASPTPAAPPPPAPSPAAAGSSADGEDIPF